MGKLPTATYLVLYYSSLSCVIPLPVVSLVVCYQETKKVV